MKYGFLKPLMLVCSLLVSFAGFSQVTANFTSNKTSGCPPLTVNFTDLSSTTSGSINSRVWDFGNGQSSTDNNATPSATYNTPGTYTVVLTVGNGTTTATKTVAAYITVFENPVANFSSDDTSGCTPLVINFDDLTVLGDAALESWSWNFGDGTPQSTNQNPTHTFSVEGDYPVSVFVTDENGCTSSSSITYSASTPHTLNFSGTNNISCQSNQDVTFSVTTDASSTATYEWDFGNGNTSTEASPVENYDGYGNYDVSLTVIDGACAVVVEKTAFVRLTEVVGVISFSDDTICPGNFISYGTTGSAGGNTYAWLFPGGSPGTAVSSVPTVTYSTPGEYETRLIYSFSGNCKDTIYKTIVVEDVNANFTADETYSCEVPFSPTFSPEDTELEFWQWSFGDNGSGNTENPSHNYDAGGLYDVSLTVTTANGCVKSLTKNDYIQIHLLSLSSTSDVKKGCIPLAVSFTDNASPNDSITSWLWDFGDGNTSTIEDPTNTYIIDGDFIVTVTYTYGADMCTLSDTMLILAGSKPIIDFSVDNDTTCAYQMVQFTDLSSDPSKNDEWFWKGIPSSFAFQSEIQDASMSQFQDTGFMDVELVVSYNGCRDTLVKEDFVYVLGAITNGVAALLNCNDVYKRDIFALRFIDTTSYVWRFGDGDSIVSYGEGGTIPNGTNGGRTTGYYHMPTHEYSSPGDYVVELEGYNGNAFYYDTDSCSYVDSWDVFVRDLTVYFEITGDSNACKNATITFDADSTEDGVSKLATSDEMIISWDFGDGATLPPDYGNTAITSSLDTYGSYVNPTHLFQQSGVFTVVASVIDINNCIKTYSRDVFVFEPQAEFTIEDAYGCYPYTSELYDASLSDTNIVSWEWSFNSSVFATTPDASFDVEDRGVVDVFLTVVDTFGCSNTISKQLLGMKPIPSFGVTDNTLCVGDNITLNSINISNSYIVDQTFPYSSPFGATGETYTWNFSDGGSVTLSNNSNPTYAFSDSGYFDISLTIIDTVGCDSTIVFNDAIHVQRSPAVGFVADQTNFDCYPVDVVFADTSVSNYIVSWDWSQGVVDNDSLYWTYSLPGSYDVGITVTTSYGCTSDTLYEDYINIVGPTAEFTISPDTICIGEAVTFTMINATNVDNWEWNFGNGADTSNINPVTHRYQTLPASGSSFLPTLIYRSTLGCEQFYSDTVFVHQVASGFTRNGVQDTDTTGCADFTVVFTKQTVGANTYQWDFGDGTTSTTQGPHTVSYPSGVYEISLIVSNNTVGCIDTVKKKIESYALPLVVGTNDQVVCEGNSLQLNATGATSYLWSPADYLDNVNISNPTSTPIQSTTYSVVGTDANGCSGTDLTTLTVIDEPDFEISPNTDTTVYIGDTVYFSATVPEGYTYAWTPSELLNCSVCLDPYYKALKEQEFTFTVIDNNSLCPSFERTVVVKVIEEYSVDLPNSIYPNSTNGNGVIYLRGWGIEKVLEYKIFNRWGELVYENPGDLNHGWDGTMNGKPQNMDTYVAVYTVQFYNTQQKSDKKHITLIR